MSTQVAASSVPASSVPAVHGAAKHKRQHGHTAVAGEAVEGCAKKGKMTPAEDLDGLVEQLLELFDGDVADVDKIKTALANYTPNGKHWEKYAHWDEHTYTRNLVHRGNGKFNLILLCWNNGHASSIHDHAGSHCFMKMMHGKLQEDLYPCAQHVKEGEAMIPCQSCDAVEGDVCYISDEVGLHRISNPSHSEGAVSLHLYSPPYQFCQSYQENLGMSRKSGAMTFTSEYGSKCNFAQKSACAKAVNALRVSGHKRPSQAPGKPK